jgi:hypothetical protein
LKYLKNIINLNFIVRLQFNSKYNTTSKDLRVQTTVKNNGKSGSIKASDNEASMRKEQNNLRQSSIESFTTPASKLKSTSKHTPPTPPSREEKKKKKKV